jgi:hypothetical protein
MLINPLNLLYGMKFEDVALKAGISKEMLIIIAIEAAIIAVAALTGVPAEKVGKVPLLNQENQRRKIQYYQIFIFM